MSEFDKLQDHIDGIERDLRIAEAREEYTVTSIDRDGTVHFTDQTGKLWKSKMVHCLFNGKFCCRNVAKVGDTVRFIPWDMVEESMFNA